MRFRTAQRVASVVPFYSTIFILIVTLLTLRRNKASARMWLKFVLMFFASGIVMSSLYPFISVTQNTILSIIVVGLVLTLVNFVLVDIQTKCINNMYEGVTKKTTMHLFVGLLIGVVLLAIVCLFTLLVSPSVDIEDKNGESNTSLAVITQEEMLSVVNEFSAKMAGASTYGESTHVSGSLKQYDYDKIVFHCQKISGIQTLQVTKIQSGSLKLNVDAEVEEGNAEIIIIIDNEYYCHVPLNEVQSLALGNVHDKTVIVRMAAESARVNISVERVIE